LSQKPNFTLDMNKIIRYFSGRYLAAWVVLISDATVVFLSYIVSTILRYNFEIQQIEFENMLLHGVVSTFIYVSIFSISRTSTGVLRHSGLNDLIRVFRSALIACLILVIIASILLYGFSYRGIWLIPKSVLIIHFLLSSFLLSLSRLVAKAAYGAFLRNNSDLKTNIVIFGAGESGRITCQTLLAGRSNPKEIMSVICFIDDNKSLQGKSLDGLPIYSPDKALTQTFIEKNSLSQVVLSTQKMSALRRREITDMCLTFGLEVKEIPPYDRWIHGQLSLQQIKPVSIENLLGRSEIALDSENIERELKDKVILISGAAGSIGRELVRQSLHFHPHKIIILDQAETPLHELEIRLKNEIDDESKFQIIVADINNTSRMEDIFAAFQPDLVLHAAAYKHVPMMEMNPLEAARTNIFGTKCLADLSIKYGIQKFVLVSTDKAVNPTNVMGASKRISEMYTQSLNYENPETSFIITRFGNVLGSSGSVIPLFQSQIESGGPVTITHQEVTRYFMTIAESCNLVLEAGSLGNNGEIYVFDMGEPVRIWDLAKKMIELSGLLPEKNIDIEFVGLRPGEKLFEEVLANKENTIPTHHEKILKATVKPVDNGKLFLSLTQLEEQINTNDRLGLVMTMKELVPEFVSANSEFVKLDNQKSSLPNEA